MPIHLPRPEKMFGRKKPPTSGKGSTPEQKPSGEWHAVEVVPGRFACPESRALVRRRFLSREAPRLPVPDCSTPWRCQCVYRHFSDRRTGARRAEDRGLPPLPWLAKNRRQKRGRRSDDGP
jgi:hypothetical protein